MEEIDFPEKVYKYRSWQNGLHKNILLYNELYLASPKDFNDPFDCRIPPNFTCLTDKEKEKYFNDLVNSKINEIEEDKREMVIKNLKRRLENPKGFQKDIEELTYSSQNKYYGILSLSRRWNSILMWSLYSECHKGFCVGFWEKKLRYHGDLGRIKQVDYNEIFPELKPIIAKTKEDMIESIFIQVFTKSSEWNFEQEYRMYRNYFDKEPLTFERLIYIPNDVFAEVVLGINISISDRNEIVRLCKFKNIPVYQAYKEPFKFEIKREIIDL